ncbi:glycogen synthase GlgA [candidate division KSB3 bacterium]|uniref:Glycogen synthase n=1 Tax=candidate division KSB3 bacterium TaxID=2044937 RepID=A0A2G6K865_9BACT|nr:MAG: glycogen synthase GlgA [candidate division KSB3 bacterium]
MFIVMVSPECAPVAKVGGLGDVIFGLSRELEIRGNSVEIILPKYDCMRYDHIYGLQMEMQDLWVPWYDGSVHCSVWFGFVHGRKCFFIEPHSHDNFFNRGMYYGCDDDPMRFAFFSKVALEFMYRSGKRPDVIHCHDWQTGLVPVLLAEVYQHSGMDRQRACYTIHNFKHQGVVDAGILWATGLGRPEYYFHHDRLRDNFNHSALNLMKGGIVYSNFVTTVSPKHAWEAKYSEFGYGLGDTLHTHSSKFGGVLNGVDYEMWNPELDPHIPTKYDIGSLDKKYWNKGALRDRLWLSQEYKPLVSYIGRLDSQKGVDLVRHAIYYSIANGAQFVLLGSSPDPAINQMFWEIKHHLNDSPDCHLELSFDEELAHLIYAGADMMIVPSNFEPCGLTQLISMKYGTVPVVRSVGGLADTVFDKDFAHDKPLHERNGFTFNEADFAAVEYTLNRAFSLWYGYPEHWRDLMINGMNYDFSWNYPGEHYSKIYDYIRHK